MRATRRLPRLAPVLILTALSACDNVKWGGAEVQLVPPPPAGGAQPGESGDASYADLGLPSGTVVFHVVKQPTGGVRVIPVAEVSGDSLRTLRRPANVDPQAYETRFRAAVLGKDAQLDLFRRGAKVGTASIQAEAPITTCGVPTATGVAVTVAAAADAPEFLAFRKGLSPDVIGEYSPPQVNGSMRTYASIVAERLVLQKGLARPRSWTGAQREMLPLEVVGGGTPEMSATYLAGDRMAIGAPDPDGWSVFYVAAYESATGFSPVYNEVRDYRTQPKAVPHLVDYLDWNGEGGNEMLIQVFGEKDTWYEAVSMDRGNRWTKVWEGEACAK